MNHEIRKNVRIIERRMYFLEGAIEDYHGVSDSWARAELKALQWALPILCDHAGVDQVYVSNGKR